MNITLHRPRFARDAYVPSSKSEAHRMLIAAAFANSKSDIVTYDAGEDIEATARCLQALGAQIRPVHPPLGNELDYFVSPMEAPVSGALLDCGESGSTLRFLVPIVGALGVDATFLRRGRLAERPMAPLTDELARHGVQVTENTDGSLFVSGQLTPGSYEIAANVSSQFITGLLFALTLLEGASTLTLTGEIESAPYIDLTVAVLSYFHAEPERSEDGRTFRIPGKKERPLKGCSLIRPEGDFSGAAFPLVAGAIGAHPVTAYPLNFRSSKQGDSAILELLERFGAKLDYDLHEGLVTAFPTPLRGISVNAKQIPDLVPILAVLAAAAEGTTVITGAARLRLKESDRIATTAAMLRALGGHVQETEDGLIIEGGHGLTGGTVDGAGDHRIVMSAAVAALIANGDVTVTGIEAVAKSYPHFFDLIKNEAN